MKARLALLVTLAVALAGAREAHAQAEAPQWLSDRKYREGMGIRVGDFELHPGIGAEFGFDSNYFRRASSPDEDPIGSLQLRLSPSFSVSTLGPQRREDGPAPTVEFRFGTHASYYEFFPVTGSEGGKLRLQEQRNIDLRADTQVGLLPGRTWSGRIRAGVTRTIQPTNEGDLTISFNRWLPDAGAELVWQPGGGLLDWRLGYEFQGMFFESGTFNNLNSFTNTVVTRGRWRFLPRTALIYDLGLGFIIYPEATAKTSSHPLRTRIGINGLITNSFALLAMVGWGASFYSGEAPQDFDSVIGQVELKWYLTPNPSANPMAATSSLSAIALGVSRDFQDSLLGTYLERDRIYARFDYFFGGTFLLALEAGAAAVVFPNQIEPDYGQPEGWTDLRVDGRLFGEYRLRDFIGLNATVDYTGYFSSTALTFPNVDPGLSDHLAYQRVAAFLGARVFW